ncbi:VOC family protein [Streptomyces sp. NPDC059255]|uniref:VOC family protein n=1 Tax=Streptomyces sp. NPDC059255 TaxID=3346793 RepID=UPI0036A249ED
MIREQSGPPAGRANVAVTATATFNHQSLFSDSPKPMTIKGPTMAIQRLNHAVLYVRNVERSVTFYTTLLGFRTVFRLHADGDRVPEVAFLQAEGSSNDHDLGLLQIDGPADGPEARGRTAGLTHLAWEVETLAELKQVRTRLIEAGALVNETDHGTTKALYAHDPDGLEFEVCWLMPAELITSETGRTATMPLDLDSDIERFGADTLGGIGVSAPVAR